MWPRDNRQLSSDKWGCKVHYLKKEIIYTHKDMSQ